MTRKIGFLMVALVLLTVTVGCTQQQFTKTSYGQVQAGMTQQDVKQAMGEPSKVEGTTWYYMNYDPDYRAVVKFDNGKVVEKGWADDRDVNKPCTKTDLAR